MKVDNSIGFMAGSAFGVASAAICLGMEKPRVLDLLLAGETIGTLVIGIGTAIRYCTWQKDKSDASSMGVILLSDIAALELGTGKGIKELKRKNLENIHSHLCEAAWGQTRPSYYVLSDLKLIKDRCMSTEHDVAVGSSATAGLAGACLTHLVAHFLWRS